MASLQRIEKLKTFLAADPEDAFTRYALALEYHGIGDSQRAVDALLELLEHDPAYIPAFQQLGQIYTALGDTGKAQDAYRRGIAAASGQHDAHAQQEMQDALEDLEDEW